MTVDVQIGDATRDETVGALVKHDGVLGPPDAYLIGAAIEREVLLITTEPRLRIGRPTYIDAV
jgi:hypothetical protein